MLIGIKMAFDHCRVLADRGLAVAGVPIVIKGISDLYWDWPLPCPVTLLLLGTGCSFLDSAAVLSKGMSLTVQHE